MVKDRKPLAESHICASADNWVEGGTKPVVHVSKIAQICGKSVGGKVSLGRRRRPWMSQGRRLSGNHNLLSIYQYSTHMHCLLPDSRYQEDWKFASDFGKDKLFDHTLLKSYCIIFISLWRYIYRTSHLIPIPMPQCGVFFIHVSPPIIALNSFHKRRSRRRFCQ